MKKILLQSFFNRSTLAVAEDLIGKYLVRRLGGKEIALKIFEIEAYDGPNDQASHGAKGKTKRTEVMFGPAGFWYVYLIYGMHWMLNIVTGPKDYPAAILIRGAVTSNHTNVNGPGRVTKFLKIDKKLNGQLASRKSGLWIEDRGVKVPKKEIIRSPRIGIEYASPEWRNMPYRYTIPFES